MGVLSLRVDTALLTGNVKVWIAALVLDSLPFGVHRYRHLGTLWLWDILAQESRCRNAKHIASPFRRVCEYLYDHTKRIVLVGQSGDVCHRR